MHLTILWPDKPEIILTEFTRVGFVVRNRFRILPDLVGNPCCFGPIPVWSGHFGPISEVSRFGPTGMGRFDPISKVGRFGPILGTSPFGLFFYFGKTVKILGSVHPDFALIKLTRDICI